MFRFSTLPYRNYHPMRESLSLFTLKKHCVKPTCLDFKYWLKEKAETHDSTKNTATKARTKDTNNSATRTKVASKAFATNTQHKSTPKPQQSSPSISISSCIVCKSSHRLGECRVCKERTPTQRAKEKTSMQSAKDSARAV